MKFILPNGEQSQEITEEFIEKALGIDAEKAKNKLIRLKQIVSEKSYTDHYPRKQLFDPKIENISFACLAMIIKNNQEKYGTPVWSSYDNDDETKEFYRREDQHIYHLQQLLLKSFPDYFKDAVKPDAKLLSAYLVVKVEYELDPSQEESGKPFIENDVEYELDPSQEESGKPLIENDEVQNVTFQLTGQYDFNDTTRKTIGEIRNKLGKLLVYSFAQGGLFDYIPSFTIPWFYIPILNKALKKLNLTIEPPKKDVSELLCLKPDAKMNETNQEIIEKLLSTELFLDMQGKITISNALEIIGKSEISFTDEVSKDKITDIAKKLNSMGLQCEPRFSVGLSNAIKISLKIAELNQWLEQNLPRTSPRLGI